MTAKENLANCVDLIRQGDCVELMAELPDQCVDLIIKIRPLR